MKPASDKEPGKGEGRGSQRQEKERRDGRVTEAVIIWDLYTVTRQAGRHEGANRWCGQDGEGEKKKKTSTSRTEEGS